jgi:hypothetical protein
MYIGPQWLLNILQKTYKEFISLHKKETDNKTRDTLRQKIINYMTEEITDTKFSVFVHILDIIEKTNEWLDVALLHREIANTSKTIGEEDIQHILEDDFLIKKLQEKTD